MLAFFPFRLLYCLVGILLRVPDQHSRFEKVDQLTLEYDDIGQPTFRTGNIGLMVGLRPIQRKVEAVNPDPNADMILPEEDDEDDKADTSNGESKAASGDKEGGDEETNALGGILVATVNTLSLLAATIVRVSRALSI
jgi:hypothetical protein